MTSRRARGSFTVLDAVDVTVGPRTRLGVVGPNGVGKTTLLRLLAGIDRPDRGTVTRTPPSLRVGYLPQEPERGDETLLAFLARRTGVAAAEAELERGGDRPGRRSRGRDRGRRLQRRARRPTSRSAAPTSTPVPARCAADLGLPERRLDTPTRALSGGQAARASLAAILLSRFDVFLLDEPTNDLDFAGLERLETLPRRPARRCGRGEPRPRVPRAHRHPGARARRAHRGRRPSTAAVGWGTSTPGPRPAVTPRRTTRRTGPSGRRLEQRARTQREWAVQGAGAAKRDASEKDKFIRHFRVAKSEKQAAKARATEKAIARLDTVEKPWEGWDLRFQVAERGAER